MLEIERKFLINAYNALLRIKGATSAPIIQGYISIPQDSKTIRLRRVGEKHFLTIKIKTKQTIQKRELEKSITIDQFNFWWLAVESRIVHKTRYYLPFGKHIFEIDFYHAGLTGLITVEIEFNSIKQANSFVPPKWFGKEVTNDSKFSNQSLATFGLPIKYQLVCR